MLQGTANNHLRWFAFRAPHHIICKHQHKGINLSCGSVTATQNLGIWIRSFWKPGFFIYFSIIAFCSFNIAVNSMKKHLTNSLDHFSLKPASKEGWKRETSAALCVWITFILGRVSCSSVPGLWGVKLCCYEPAVLLLAWSPCCPALIKPQQHKVQSR